MHGHIRITNSQLTCKMYQPGLLKIYQPMKVVFNLNVLEQDVFGLQILRVGSVDWTTYKSSVCSSPDLLICFKNMGIA